MRRLETRKCYFAKNENFFTVEIAGAPAGHEYRVFFAVRRDTTHADTATLIVQSAYFGPVELRPKGQTRKQVRFLVILSNALLGKATREPP